MKRTIWIALVAACASAKTETRPAAENPAPAAARESAAAQPAPSAPASAQGPAASPAPATVDANGAGAAAGSTKPSQPAPSGGTSPAAQVTQSSPNAAPEPPMMPDQPFRAAQPGPLAVQPHFEAPVPVQRKLKNGARVLIVENHSLPLVAIDLRFLHGIDLDPPDKPGLAEFVADTVDEGTRSRPAEKLAAEIEDLAAHLGAGAARESTTVHLNCLTETLPRALALFADVVQNPAFRKEDVERVRVLRLTGLAQKAASIGALAGDEVSKILFGPNHPWGKPAGGTPQSVASITPEDLHRFHDTYWVPNDAVVSVSGDVKPDEIVALLDHEFASWKAKPFKKPALPPVPPLKGRHIDGLDKPNATQSQVWVVGRLFKATDPDAIPLRVANMTLGGMFTSRLNMNLREEHAYSYGVGSRISLAHDTGTFAASGGIIAKNTAEAVGEYEKELEKFAKGGATAAELAAAKEALVRALPSALETNDAVAGGMGNLVSLGLPLDYYKTLPSRVNRVTQKDVKRVAAKWIKPSQWPIVVVGPLGPVKDGLEKLRLGAVSIAPAPGSGTQTGAPQPSGAK